MIPTPTGRRRWRKTLTTALERLRLQIALIAERITMTGDRLGSLAVGYRSREQPSRAAGSSHRARVKAFGSALGGRRLGDGKGRIERGLQSRNRRCKFLALAQPPPGEKAQIAGFIAQGVYFANTCCVHHRPRTRSRVR